MPDVIPPPAPPRLALVQHVHVRVGRCHIAVPIDQVQQALPLPPQGLTALPRRSGGLLGVADVDGAAVPIVALERWVPLETGGDAAAGVPRLLVLQHAGALVGIRVDAVLGVKAVAAADIRRVHHPPAENELFESVVPASAGAPTLCILEVARLMQLGRAWCAAAELAPAGAADAVASARASPPGSRTQRHAGFRIGVGHWGGPGAGGGGGGGAGGGGGGGGARPRASPPGSRTQRHAVFRIGVEHWAVPVDAVERVAPVPATELALGRAQRSWAIGQWQGRKVPLVLGLTVSACEQFVDLVLEAVARTPGEALVAGVVLLPDLGKLQVLDVGKLFGLTPEASISRSAQAATLARSDAELSDATEPLPYLVFDADQRYATPVEGIVGVVELPTQAREDLRQGRQAVLAWRGQTVRLVSLPAIARTGGQNDPLLAVLVQAPGGTAPPIGIAIRSLCDWLPAHSVRRSGMRMGAMGEFGLNNAKGEIGRANLVVVDLAQMAYLLG